MRFFQAMFLGLFLLSTAEGKEEFHVKGPFDLDGNKLNECLIFNGKEHSVLLVELFSPQKNDTLWTYTFEEETTIADGNFIAVVVSPVCFIVSAISMSPTKLDVPLTFNVVTAAPLSVTLS